MPQPHFKNKNSPQPMGKKIKHLALGGTFDRFHKGHRHFLNNAFSISKKVTIGVTDESYARKVHYNELLQPYKQRRESVKSYLHQTQTEKNSEIITLSDPYGPTTHDRFLEALLVTENTRVGGKRINQQRRELNLRPLKLFNCELTLAEDGKPISSTRIRQGYISREGEHYSTKLLNAAPITISRKHRATFREPYGKIILGDVKDSNEVIHKVMNFVRTEKLSPIVSVGDDVTSSLLAIGTLPDVSIVDLHVRRKRKYKDISEYRWPNNIQHNKVINPAGTITSDLSILLLEQIHNSPVVIEVIGEEDLAVLPCILAAPLNAVVIYGHFEHGVVIVPVTENKKTETLHLMEKISK